MCLRPRHTKPNTVTTLLRKSRALRILVAIPVALAAMAFAGLCWLLLQLPDPNMGGSYQTALAESVSLNEAGETVVHGRVFNASRGCEIGGPREGREDCRFILQYKGLSIYVYYFYSPGGESCLNTEASRQGSLVWNAYTVEVFGKYYGPGSISTCDSPDYYIQRVENE